MTTTITGVTLSEWHDEGTEAQLSEKSIGITSIKPVNIIRRIFTSASKTLDAEV